MKTSYLFLGELNGYGVKAFYVWFFLFIDGYVKANAKNMNNYINYINRA